MSADPLDIANGDSPWHLMQQDLLRIETEKKQKTTQDGSECDASGCRRLPPRKRKVAESEVVDASAGAVDGQPESKIARTSEATAAELMPPPSPPPTSPPTTSAAATETTRSPSPEGPSPKRRAGVSHVRSRFMLASLQEQMRQMKQDNATLRAAIKQHCPAHIAAEVLRQVPHPSERRTAEPVIRQYGEAPSEQKPLVPRDMALIHSLSTAKGNFVITDPTLPMNPIVFVSSGFLELTGYEVDEVLGRNCKFLQGPDTDPRAIDVIREGVREGTDVAVCMLNYKKDGTRFWNQFFMAPLRGADGEIVNYVGVQHAVDRPGPVAKAAKKKTPMAAAEPTEATVVTPR